MIRPIRTQDDYELALSRVESLMEQNQTVMSLMN